MDPLKPSIALLMKLGSLVVHAEEFFSPKGHPYDKAAIDGLLQDQEVKDWLEEMDKLAFLPKKR